MAYLVYWGDDRILPTGYGIDESPRREGDDVDHLHKHASQHPVQAAARGIGRAVSRFSAGSAVSDGLRLSLIHISEPTRPY